MSENSPHVLGELSAYLDRRLARVDRKRVDAHLGSCASCQRHADELRAMRNLIQETPQVLSRQRSWFLVKSAVVAGVVVGAIWIFRGRPRSAASPELVAAPVTEKIVVPQAKKVAPKMETATDRSVVELRQLADTPVAQPVIPETPVEIATPAVPVPTPPSADLTPPEESTPTAAQP